MSEEQIRGLLYALDRIAENIYDQGEGIAEQLGRMLVQLEPPQTREEWQRELRAAAAAAGDWADEAASGAAGRMSEQRFNELLTGPLSHPLPMFVITRLALALRTIVEATGEKGSRALEAYCAAQEERDAFNGQN